MNSNHVCISSYQIKAVFSLSNAMLGYIASSYAGNYIHVMQNPHEQREWNKSPVSQLHQNQNLRENRHSLDRCDVTKGEVLLHSSTLVHSFCLCALNLPCDGGYTLPHLDRTHPAHKYFVSI